jgi:hypothetical protein
MSLWCTSCQSSYEVDTQTYDGDFDLDFIAWQGLENADEPEDVLEEPYKDNYVYANTDLSLDNVDELSALGYYGSKVGGLYKGTSKKGSPKGKGGGTQATYTKCRHYHVPINVAEDVIIYPSSMNNNPRTEDTHINPDFGLYADTGWKPAWRNEFIVFPDYSIPSFDIAIEQITWAVEYAAEGAVVEIGCIGGHGRTGVILACMKVWGSHRDDKPISAVDAVKWVRSNYCSHAIETKEQEWWVNYYSHHEFGEPLSKKPEPKVKKWETSRCSVRDHKEMEAAGATECLRSGDKCSFWVQDLSVKTDMLTSPLDPVKINNWRTMLAASKTKKKVEVSK